MRHGRGGWPGSRNFEITLVDGGEPLYVTTDGWKVLAWAIDGYRKTGSRTYGGTHLGYGDHSPFSQLMLRSRPPAPKVKT